MSRKGRMTAAKRQRERAVAERRKEKQERRVGPRADGLAQEGLEPGDDPDLAGIVPGPQPLQAWQVDALEE